MEVNGVTYPGLNPSLNMLAGRDIGGPVAENSPNARAVERAEQEAVRLKATEPNQRKEAVDLEKLVPQPREVSFEERMEQVISLEDIQRILLVRSPFSMKEMGENPGGMLDFKT